MNLLALPALTDNYIWMLHDDHEAIVVDPGDCAPVLQALSALNLVLVGILVTHRHPDHVQGIAGLRSCLRGPVYGPAKEAIPEPYRPVHEADIVQLMGINFTVWDVPGHTAGHVAYWCNSDSEIQAPFIFCGDTLFSAGCGRLYDGTALQLHQSLQRLKELPRHTLVYCTHEYTLANLRFAQTVEPHNEAIQRHTNWCELQRSHNQPTLPSTVGLELEINPFMRCTQASVIQSLVIHGRSPRVEPDVELNSAQVFTALRQWKNEFQ